MPHPKRPEEKGIAVSLTSTRILSEKPMTDQLLALEDEAEAKIQKHRADLRHAVENKKPVAKKSAALLLARKAKGGR